MLALIQELHPIRSGVDVDRVKEYVALIENPDKAHGLRVMAGAR